MSSKDGSNDIEHLYPLYYSTASSVMEIIDDEIERVFHNII